MVIFLTSSPTGDLDNKYTCEGFDNRNGFVDALKSVWRENANVLMITAFPDNDEANAEMYEFFIERIECSGLSLNYFELWDRDTLDDPELYERDRLQSFDVIILGGGHLPTENEFFRQLNLRESIQGFTGIVIGISAGTMNCADVVYAQPEEPGEAIDPDYERFIQGLGITDFNILPHYQMVKDNILDGMHLYEEITLPDSVGNSFIALPDGSYLVDWNDMTLLGNGEWVEPMEPTVHGEAYLVEDGQLYQISEEWDVI